MIPRLIRIARYFSKLKTSGDETEVKEKSNLTPKTPPNNNPDYPLRPF
jgi:hypothetical protein